MLTKGSSLIPNTSHDASGTFSEHPYIPQSEESDSLQVIPVDSTAELLYRTPLVDYA